MTLAIAINKQIYRNDSTIYPKLTISGITDIGKIKLVDWQYYTVENGTSDLTPSNYDNPNASVNLRNVKRPTWTRDSDIDLTDDNDLVNASSTGYHGASSSTTLSTIKCSLEAKPNALYTDSPDVLGIQDYLSISLQSGTVTKDFTSVDSHHSISFGDYGKATIREKGVIPNVNGTFQYEIGDSALIELDSGIVRYYLVKASNEMILIRTTRSKLTGPPKPVVTIYLPGGQLDNIFTFSYTDEVTTIFKNVSVLQNFQNWLDDYVLNPQSDVLQMADNENEYTYPSHKKYLRSLSLSRPGVAIETRTGFLKFFQYHLNDRPFIFVDKARQNPNIVAKQSDEFWAKFSGGFGDKTHNGCRFANTVEIVEINCDKYIPLEVPETTPPTTPTLLTFIADDDSMTGTWTESVDTGSGLDHYNAKITLGS